MCIDSTADRLQGELNAVDEMPHEELTALFPLLQRERTTRAIHLTGRGRAFSAGGDFTWFPNMQDPMVLEHIRLDPKQYLMTGAECHAKLLVVGRAGLEPATDGL